MTDADTTTPDAATLLREAFAAINARDLETLQTFWHEDIVVLGPIKGKENVAAFFAEMFAAVPDLEFTTEQVMPIDATTAVGEWALRHVEPGAPSWASNAMGARCRCAESTS